MKSALIFLFFLLTAARSAAPESGLTARAPATEVHWNHAPLTCSAFAPLWLGSVKPRGWLERQPRIQADGLTGHLDEFWEDPGPDSRWLDREAESCERWLSECAVEEN